MFEGEELHDLRTVNFDNLERTTRFYY